MNPFGKNNENRQNTPESMTPEATDIWRTIVEPINHRGAYFAKAAAYNMAKEYFDQHQQPVATQPDVAPQVAATPEDLAASVRERAAQLFAEHSLGDMENADA